MCVQEKCQIIWEDITLLSSSYQVLISFLCRLPWSSHAVIQLPSWSCGWGALCDIFLWVWRQPGLNWMAECESLAAPRPQNTGRAPGSCVICCSVGSLEWSLWLSISLSTTATPLQATSPTRSSPLGSVWLSVGREFNWKHEVFLTVSTARQLLPKSLLSVI